MTQLNTPYPAIAYLSGFLLSRGYESKTFDASLELFLRLFSKQGLTRIKQCLEKKNSRLRDAGKYFLDNFDQYYHCVDDVVGFLQGQRQSLAYRIVAGDFVPLGPTFRNYVSQFVDEDEDALAWAFGQNGIADRAKHICSLLVDDVAQVIHESIDSNFSLAKYAEQLAASQPKFDDLYTNLTNRNNLLDQFVDEIASELYQKYEPQLIGFSLPFPGNVYGGLRLAHKFRQIDPRVKIIIGGGYVNTELRSLKDIRLFQFVDFITYDDGEQPLLSIIQHLEQKSHGKSLLRTSALENNSVVTISDKKLHDVPIQNSGIPNYKDLNPSRYVSLLEMLNPMHRLWSDGYWNKLTLAHGCYWRACNFCDLSLDYINRYEEDSIDRLIIKIEKVMEDTGSCGFHFVDEAAPPKILFSLAKKIIDRGLVISWWTNIRFEKTFNRDLTLLLAKSGCIAMSGGLEVASDRLLKLMNKGVTVEQVAKVTKAFSNANILVHAYLMFV